MAVRNVRNFWIKANIDGRNTALEGGPPAKDGGFDLTITQRSARGIDTALRVVGLVHADGQVIEVQAFDARGFLVWSNMTERD